MHICVDVHSKLVEENCLPIGVWRGELRRGRGTRARGERELASDLRDAAELS
jgi:hypothetical protein